MPKRNFQSPTVARRVLAVRMFEDGATDQAVANAVGLSRPTVRRYRALYRSGGLEALVRLSVGGRGSTLGEEGMMWLEGALRDSARNYGFEGDAWTNSRVRALIQQKYGVRFSRVYIWQLATNLGLGHVLSKSRR
ncbi:helix-turn-helix domain-containing protein [Caballeronia sp. RCC_10]|uniref:helix-turn-helix domain-containing protein n=1 Tax=Caballeronia sp. RCC_10 TaxID=3239227 RepID=UPI0035231EBF